LTSGSKLARARCFLYRHLAGVASLYAGMRRSLSSPTTQSQLLGSDPVEHPLQQVDLDPLMARVIPEIMQLVGIVLHVVQQPLGM